MKPISIVVPIFNNVQATLHCLDDVFLNCGPNVEVIAVDDGSPEPISKIVSKCYPSAKLLTNSENLGFAKSVNRGIQAASHDLICLLNNDIRITNAGWLRKLEASMDTYDLTGPAGGVMNSKWHYQGEVTSRGKPFTYLTFWCCLIKREVFDAIGLVPEEMGVGFFEDVLFCHRAKKHGFTLGITEDIGIIHEYHSTFKKEGYDLSNLYQEKRRVFLSLIGREKPTRSI